MHTIERYFSNVSMELTDHLSEALLRTVIDQAYILMLNPNDYQARAEIMWASSLSHNGLLGLGTDGGDWSPHQLEHELGGMFDVAHGAGISAVWGSWARYVYKSKVERFATFATQVMDVPPHQDLEGTALAGIAALESFFRDIQMPTTITELGIEVTDEEIQLMSEKCSFYNTRTIGIIKPLNTEDIAAIYKMAR
jgi:alcohol dehydrogenase YqhD (iron-dependent ADH family)